MSRQQSNGEWLQEGIEGVFNKASCFPFHKKNVFLTLYFYIELYDKLPELQILFLHLGTWTLCANF